MISASASTLPKVITQSVTGHDDAEDVPEGVLAGPRNLEGSSPTRGGGRTDGGVLFKRTGSARPGPRHSPGLPPGTVASRAYAGLVNRMLAGRIARAGLA